MKKFKGFWIALLFILLSTTLCFAGTGGKYKPYASSLAQLGMFTGTELGYELDRAPTRTEGTIMLIRLLGAEEEAKQIKENTTPFTDVPPWAAGYISYAYQQGLTNGLSDTTFGSQVTMNAKMYITYLLRSLGYQDSGDKPDFSFGNSLVFAKEITLIDEDLSKEMSQAFLRGHVARTSYEALRFPYHNTYTLLIEKLTAEGKVSSTKANIFISNPVSVSDFSNKDQYDPQTFPSREELTTEKIAENVSSMVMISCASTKTITTGSGIIISADGEILTNYHVIEGASEIAIKFNNNEIYSGTVYVQDYDADVDLAVLKIQKDGLTPVSIGDSDGIRLGQKVVAIGSPMGLFNTVSEGIISSIRDNLIQTSAAISHGSSGGALFDTYGQVIGITYAGVENGQNLGFAIPINNLRKVSEKNMQPFASATGADIRNTSRTSPRIRANESV